MTGSSSPPISAETNSAERAADGSATGNGRNRKRVRPPRKDQVAGEKSDRGGGDDCEPATGDRVDKGADEGTDYAEERCLKGHGRARPEGRGAQQVQESQALIAHERSCSPIRLRP